MIERSGMKRARIEGWELRLAELVEAARRRPRALGEHDCATFAFAAIEACTGWTPDAAMRGSYATLPGALRHAARLSGGSPELADAVDAVLGRTGDSVAHAQRGDLALCPDDAGVLHLAVVIGADVCWPGERGLAFGRLRACTRAWRIG